jgi:quercetin dioxygenase-like cupin family protein
MANSSISHQSMSKQTRMSTSTTNLSTPAGTKRGPAEYFNGTAWVTMLAGATPTDCTVGDVTFEPGARNNWHSHPAGQVLVVTAGSGYYQEKGRPAQLLRPNCCGPATR